MEGAADTQASGRSEPVLPLAIFPESGGQTIGSLRLKNRLSISSRRRKGRDEGGAELEEEEKEGEKGGLLFCLGHTHTLPISNDGKGNTQREPLTA